MTELVRVSFHGAELLAVAGSTPAETLIAMKPVVEGMGLDWGGQYKKIAAHPVLATCVSLTEIQVSGDQRRARVFLPLNRLNFWLATIQPDRVKDPAIRAKVIGYQTECADVLFNHFFGDRLAVPVPTSPVSGADPADLDRSDLRTWIALVAECRSTFGRPAARRLWRRLPLPQPEGEGGLPPDALAPEDEWWKSCLSAGRIVPGQTWWPSEIAVSDLMAAAGRALAGHGLGHGDLESRVGRMLFRLVPGLSRRRPRGAGAGRAWVYVLPPLDECRARLGVANGD